MGKSSGPMDRLIGGRSGRVFSTALTTLRALDSMAEQIIENPSYMENIRYFFDEVDHIHMWNKGIDLSTYEGLVSRGSDIYFQTRPPDATMPPEENRKWSKERSETFRNWIENNFPYGVPTQAEPLPMQVDRLRKDVDNLSKDEINTLKSAFEGLMARNPKNPQSYFALASIHWFPPPTLCQHHVDKYNPWHRAYLKLFEDALRTVEGCEEVTLPYWDIRKPPPYFFFRKPFASYTLPEEIHSSYEKGYVTSRYSRQAITRRVKADGIPETIDTAMKQSDWNSFVTYRGPGIEAAHDAGHGAVGETLSNADAASFDPIFWFFHSNWDRLWWEWQQRMRATTFWTFRSTIRGDTTFLEAPFDDLKPFSLTSGATIDLRNLGISYELQRDTEIPSLMGSGFGSLEASRSIAVRAQPTVSVRLKGINRTKLPGSFRAELFADGERIGQRVFFQSTQPLTCENCRASPFINLDFVVSWQSVVGKRLSVEMHVLTSEPGLGSRFPLASCGNPKLNLRLLLEEQ